MTLRKTRPEEFEDRIIVTSTFNDIEWTKNKSDFARKLPLGPWYFLGLGEEANGMERKITNLKNSDILLQMSSLPISKKADIQSAGFPVRWIGDP